MRLSRSLTLADIACTLDPRKLAEAPSAALTAKHDGEEGAGGPLRSF